MIQKRSRLQLLLVPDWHSDEFSSCLSEERVCQLWYSYHSTPAPPLRAQEYCGSYYYMVCTESCSGGILPPGRPTT